MTEHNKQDQIENAFKYHRPKSREVADNHELVRGWAKTFADCILQSTPSSREQSVALTKVEEAMFWANAAIARYQFEGGIQID